MMLVAVKSHAAQTISNAQIVNVSVSTGAAALTQVVDMRNVDYGSWQMNFTCAKGSATLSESDDAQNWVSLNVAGSSITVNNASGARSTVANQIFSLANVPFAWLQFNVTNSSAPANPNAGLPCTFNATQALKSVTVTGN